MPSRPVTRARPRNPAPRGTEQALALLWQRADSLSEGLVTEDGRRFRVVYPGRPSHRAGPDFHDSLIATDAGDIISGDVEVHLEAPDWDRHHHDADPNYNGVVLHVVLRTRGRTASHQQSGVDAPIASLEAAVPALSRAAAETPLPLAGVASLDDRGLGEVLDRGGDERFAAKRSGFLIEAEGADPEEVLYRALLEALGYSTNREPFRALARRVPFGALVPLGAQPPVTRLLALRALLTHASGLLPLVEPAAEREQLRRLLRRLPTFRPMPASLWRTFRVRPANHPLRRVTGAACLVDRFLRSGIVAGTEEAARQGAGELLALLTVPPLVGRGRALDMTVNVVLPFLGAWAELRGEATLRRRCLRLYAALPRPAENEITREMGRLLGLDRRGPVVSNARRHQGLIQLYRARVQRASR